MNNMYINAKTRKLITCIKLLVGLQGSTGLGFSASEQNWIYGHGVG